MLPPGVIPPPRGGVALAGLGAAALDLALGSRCLLCRRPGALCCPWCRERLECLAREAPVGRVEGLRVSCSMPVVAAVPYRSPVSGLIHSYKEHGALSLTPVLAGLLALAIDLAVTRMGLDTAPVVLVPVPSRPAARRRRGDEPTRTLARAAARVFSKAGVPVAVENALRTRGVVADQAALGAVQRKANVANSMVLRGSCGERLAAGSIVLVDDVVTTGATLYEANRALQVAGFAPLFAATIAATPPPHQRS